MNSEVRRDAINHAAARSTDPTTSWEAARSLGLLTGLQERVWLTLALMTPVTDEQLYDAYNRSYGGRGQPIAPSTVRSRRKELQDLGLVEVVDRNGKTKGGRRCQRFQVAQ